MTSYSRRRKRLHQRVQQRAARRRILGLDGATVARMQCGTCGLQFTQPGMLLRDVSITEVETGTMQRIPLDGAIASATCPRCGAQAIATNQHVETDAQGRSIAGFADTPAQVKALRDSLAELRTLDDDATLEEIVAVLEAQGPAVAPLAAYVRDNYQFLTATGIGLLALVVALLTWLMPRSADEGPAPVPDGITYEQMEQLLQEVRESGASNPGRPEHDRSRGKSKSQKRAEKPARVERD